MPFISKAKNFKKKSLLISMKSIKSTWRSAKFKTNTKKKSEASKKSKKRRTPDKGKSTSKPSRIKMLFSKNSKNKWHTLLLCWVIGNLLMMKSNHHRVLQIKIKILKAQTDTKSKKEKKPQKFHKFWTPTWIRWPKSQLSRSLNESSLKKVLRSGQGLKKEQTRSVQNKQRKFVGWKTIKFNKQENSSNTDWLPKEYQLKTQNHSSITFQTHRTHHKNKIGKSSIFRWSKLWQFSKMNHFSYLKSRLIWCRATWLRMWWMITFTAMRKTRIRGTLSSRF